MPIPADILKVPRPINTIVIRTRKPDVYGVRKRIGCKRDGKRCLPINGPTIGHIINYEYIPKENSTTDILNDSKELIDQVQGSSTALDFNEFVSQPSSIPLEQEQSTKKGNETTVVNEIKDSCVGADISDCCIIMMAFKVLGDIYNELLEVYCESDVHRIISISILRACYPGVKDYELKTKYNESVLRFLFPEVRLGKNDMTVFNHALGGRCSKIVKFMKIRTKSIDENELLLIDGTLKSDESKVNSLSSASRKAKDKGSKDINLLVLYSYDKHEPVCSMCYPGNTTDIAAFPSFLEYNKVTRGILVGDKGFPYTVAKAWFHDHPDLHFISPVKRNTKYVKRHDLRNYKKKLPLFEDVMFKKVFDKQDKVWVYSFHNAKISAKEQYHWIENFKESFGSLKEAYDDFGNVDIVSDLDLPAEKIYGFLVSRWEIEVSMKFYKMSLELDETRENMDFSVIGSELMNFIAHVINMRMNNEYAKYNILQTTKTYKEARRILTKAKIVRIVDDDINWTIAKLTLSERKVLSDLSLIGPNGFINTCKRLPEIRGI